MATPKKIKVFTVSAQDGKRTLDWVFTLDGDKVIAKQMREDPFYPTVFDENHEGGYLTPDDGPRFMEVLKDAHPRADYVSIEVED